MVAAAGADLCATKQHSQCCQRDRAACSICAGGMKSGSGWPERQAASPKLGGGGSCSASRGWKPVVMHWEGARCNAGWLLLRLGEDWRTCSTVCCGDSLKGEC